ncbi:MAG: lysostaphin resistance A-like protein [Candidatus Hodarchaeota archaeon]
MTIAQTEKAEINVNQNQSIWSQLSLPILAMIMLAVGATWRVVDVFVLNLGSTWINILPSKLGPLLILLGLFYFYRRNQLDEVLGIHGDQFRIHVIVGFFVFAAMYLIVDIGASIIFASFIDPSYPLDFRIVSANLLLYSFVFFLINATFEETLFRGLLQNGLRTRYSFKKAILFSSIVFGFWHVVWPIANGSSLSEAGGILFVSAFLGVLFGVYYERFSSRRTLTGPITAHTLVNFANENFKVGPDPVVQGPDFTFMEPQLMLISLVLLIVTFSMLTIVMWKYRIEDVRTTKMRLRQHIRQLTGKLRVGGLNQVPKNNQMYPQIGGNDNCR